ncbi:hypothetical protein CNMCM5623_001886 [Aspergillus felis]|uniref:Uncharacterized protein n=1 Tax=Aspergillus felis TaxID=1287682 RepID=A0A8H6V5Z2_9EURO|nr:hypothetical protein CNMCM5623_001886 [Aspergillus felis]KAF7179022.1 hypothetical protein CNMCM7691_007897 [Aspergillus felis]
MHFSLAFVLVMLTIMAHSTTAVTIRNYENRGCGGRFKACRNVRQQACCDSRPGRSYGASRFLGLPTTAIGSICTHNRGKNCGIVKKSGHGLGLCLSNPSSRGSYWFDCRSCRRDAAVAGEVSDVQILSADDVVEPDIIAFDEEHQFDIGPTTPQNAKEALHQYYESNATYADIPEELKAYEIDADMDEE